MVFDSSYRSVNDPSGSIELKNWNEVLLVSDFAAIQVIEHMIYATTMPPIVRRLCLKQGKILYMLPQRTV